MFTTKKSQPPLSQIVPVQNPLATAAAIPQGLRLTAPRTRTALGKMLGIKASDKTFELDGKGAAVWQLCDGRRTVVQIVDLFATEQDMPSETAFTAVTTFLNTLASRRLIAFIGPK